MAAAFAVIVSVMLLVPRISDDYPIIPSTHPLSSGNASSITSSAPATTITPPTSTVPPVSTEGGVPPATGGMNWNREYYDENFQESFFLEGYLPFSEYKQAFEEWKKEFVMFGKTGGRENFEYNTYTMITELGLPREQVEEWSYHYFATIYDPKVYENTGILTEEELDRIYSGDKAGYYQLKVSPFAFVVGEYVINMRWLDEHSVEDYREVGITYEKLIEYGVEGMFGKYCPEKLDEVMAKVNKLKKA